ncbi:hypothetical protein BDZ94DRAFT_707917 [Collybia nuda]|uniref:Large ribosomal subunit protein mL54 n=1 Tax=Collybia nuda TaxID=64659 RepID=A0A9P6CJF2_9AGAR|nr:hypothetical protein BDZ94DRAFT_707917 [Collybia nuda]
MSFLRALQQPQICRLCRTRGIATSTGPAATANTVQKPKKGASAACAPDTILTGINYLKGQAPVLALADDQYPEWLWTILTPKVWPEDGPGGKAERVRRKAENQRRIKDRNFMSTQ